MKTTISITLPIDDQSFGGIVGSRVTAAAVQIAYLEKGDNAKVRYIEEPLPAEEIPRAVDKIHAIALGKYMALDVEIVTETEKHSVGHNATDDNTGTVG